MATLRTQPSDRDQDVLVMFHRGVSDQDMAEALGVTVSCIRRDRQYLGLLREAPPAAHVSDAVLTAHHGAGRDNAEIARLTGLTRRTVQERLHRLHLPSRRAR